LFEAFLKDRDKFRCPLRGLPRPNAQVHQTPRHWRQRKVLLLLVTFFPSAPYSRLQLFLVLLLQLLALVLEKGRRRRGRSNGSSSGSSSSSNII